MKACAFSGNGSKRHYRSGRKHYACRCLTLNFFLTVINLFILHESSRIVEMCPGFSPFQKKKKKKKMTGGDDGEGTGPIQQLIRARGICVCVCVCVCVCASLCV